MTTLTIPHPKHPLTLLKQTIGLEAVREALLRHAETVGKNLEIFQHPEVPPFFSQQTRSALHLAGLVDDEYRTPGRWANTPVTREARTRFTVWLSAEENQVQTLRAGPSELSWNVRQQGSQLALLAWALPVGETVTSRLLRPGDSSFGWSTEGAHPGAKPGRSGDPRVMLKLPDNRLLIPEGLRISGSSRNRRAALHGLARSFPLDVRADQVRWHLREERGEQHLNWTATLTLHRHGPGRTWTSLCARPWEIVTLRLPGGEILIADGIHALNPETGAYGARSVTLTLRGRSPSVLTAEKQ